MGALIGIGALINKNTFEGGRLLEGGRLIESLRYVNNQERISLVPIKEGFINLNGCCRPLTQEQ